jgi:hypothetical protein
MIGQSTSGLGDEGKRAAADSWGDGVPGEIIYVGRASFRVAREGDRVAWPDSEAAVWLSPGPSSAPGSAREGESASEASGSEIEVPPIAVGVGLSRRVPRGFKPSLWTLVIGPITAAFLLGMLVSPRRFSSPVRLTTNPVTGRPSLAVHPEERSPLGASVVRASAPIIASPVVAPAFEVAPPRLPQALEAKTPVSIETATKVAFKRITSKKLHAPRSDRASKASAGETSEAAAVDSRDVADAPAPKPAGTRWIDPWAD